MQFLHLFSFVVVASYAAALPQPAGLSEKYPNDVDATLAPGLEARSYQPGSNSYKDSAAVMLLKRQDGTKDIKKILDDATKRGDFSSANISSTIDKVGDGILIFPRTEKKLHRRLFPVFLGKSKELTDSVTAKEKEVAEATSNILKDTGTVIQNVEKFMHHLNLPLIVA
ncbi:hypothetical protein BASA50_009179 [Batrachochytrium salamandrivorans]|uniref:RxLR effector protein n=1 Tax=Batrachochytrium salamandrivorans TaxID=1357716 RepID=A0ABQ8F217_9FUNG|nr:hypothetical protein BASA50_009179 [Batrachochytrium salamandrivorans]